MKRLHVALAAWLMSAAPLFSGEITDAAAKAEALFGEGKYQESLAALDTAREAIWQKAPLTFGKTLFVVSDPAGYGVYDLRDNNEFKPGEQLVIYTEPQGYAHGRDGAIYVMNMKLDFEIRNKAGESLAQCQVADGHLRARVDQGRRANWADPGFDAHAAVHAVLERHRRESSRSGSTV